MPMNLDVALSALLVFSAACYLMMGLRLVASQREVGSMPIGVLLVILGIWVAGAGLELISESFAIFSIGRTGHFIGTALVPVVLYVCFREYTGVETRVRTLALLCLIPLTSIALAASNASHELMWHLPAANSAGEFLTRPERWGLWFLLVHSPYSYALLGAAMITLIGQRASVAPAHRRGLFLFSAACVVPMAATVAYDLGYGPNTMSFVPLVLVATLPIYGWLIIREKIVEFTPLAYEAVFQHMQDPVVVVDDDCRVISLNHGAEKMLSIIESAALREPLESLFGDESPEVFEALDSGEPRKMMTKTGRFLHIKASPIETSRTSARGGKVLMFRDVTDVERAQIEVRKNEKLLRTIINHSVNGVIRFRWSEHENGGKVLRSIFANAAAGRFLDRDANDLVDRVAPDLIRIVINDMDKQAAAEILRRFQLATEKGDSIEAEVRQSQGGVERWLRMICEPMGDDIATTFVDITDSKAREQHMESIATSDPLTGVSNRRGFERDAAERLTASEDDATGALYFIDLNDFKEINDRYGHEVGDQVLCVAAERLRKKLRSCDIIGRPGGDEFVALVPDVDADVADKLALRLTKGLDEPYVIGAQKLRCPASIGFAMYPENARTLTGLLREADQAMYRAKARCRGVTHIHGKDRLEKAI